ncbi:hypothetical protein BV911_05230 [Pseudoruegeria sp. SK021]|nr:hypothetical protein BV911_05230 [Pseudoruegeria sp. SK021]
MKNPDFIAVDWGSTAFRAWAMTLDGAVLEAKSTEDGLKSITNRDFEAVIRRSCGDWLSANPQVPIVLCGMVGSRTGWAEAPYVDCPVLPAGLAEQAIHMTMDGHRLAILPGACTRNAHGDLDVMRGEELQLLGLVQTAGLSDAVICIPGTHCKWARLHDGALAEFRTFVTGELFQLLRNQSLLGALADGDAYDAAAFRRGVTRGADYPLSHAVFAARANTLGGTLTPTALSSYLSGILIGAEIAAQTIPDGAEVVLLASGVLADRYAAALEFRGIPSRLIDAKDATRAGLLLAAQQLWFQDVPA